MIRFNYPKLYGCFLFMALLQNNCQVNKIEEQKNAIFSITVGSGGGFTGLFTGYNFYSNGIVEYWQHCNADKNSILWISKVKPIQFDSLQMQLLHSGALMEDLNEKGNETYSVSYNTPDTIYNWSWNEMSKVPMKFKKWHNDAMQFFKRIRK